MHKKHHPVVMTSTGGDVPKLLLRPEEAAACLGLSRSKVYGLIWRKELPVVHVGKNVRMPYDELVAWVAGVRAAQR